MKDERDFKFDKRAAAYDEGFEGKTSRKFYDLMLREIDVKQGDFLLDVGCGTGALLNKIVNAHGVNAYGIDTEENMLAVAKSKYPNMEFQLSRCEDMPFEKQTFDVLIACMAYHHFSEKEGFAKEAARVLKSGGALYIADPRFPFAIRKTLNGLLRLIRVTGEFFKPDEIAARFLDFGFEYVGFTHDGYAQIVKLKRC
jgi:ubiquinone/menaquinone biosynthesis C-methylase UbiE